MFEPLYRLIKNIKSLEHAQNKLSVSVFKIPEVNKFILRLNLVDQLYEQGIDANDKIIGTYSYTTAIENGEKHYIYNGLVSVKQYGEPYTLYDTGEFYASFKVIIDKDGFTITADTVKPDKDLMDYGEIVGLTKESKNELSKKILPFLQVALKEYILGN